ncbi:uncharacterized protein LOC141648263 isoform X1 [Silene latifolia]|uniref:uncharacterized protein LOC141648263 isoform X1 n=1 Tax=Silene latifolia TaxID=37657 RepID=UPI003D7830E8
MPSTLMAMRRLNRPSIMIYGGTIKPEHFQGRTFDIVSAFQMKDIQEMRIEHTRKIFVGHELLKLMIEEEVERRKRPLKGREENFENEIIRLRRSRVILIFCLFVFRMKWHQLSTRKRRRMF